MRYLFQRKEGGNYYVRLQPPGGKVIERSLATTDLKAAELAASDLIRDHKAYLYQRRQARVARVVHGPWATEYPPGLHKLEDGGHVLATESLLTFTDATGAIISTRPNGGPAIYLSGARLPAAREFEVLDAAWEGKIGEGPVPQERPTLVTKDSHPDDALIELYIRHNDLDRTSENQTRNYWRDFRTVIKKPLRDCTRDDGRALVAYWEDEAKGNGRELKSATLKKRMTRLCAAVNLAIAEGKHAGINPFESVVVDRKDADTRAPYSDEDIKKIRANLHKLDKQDQLLVRVLATTGVRRGEAFEIASEATEGGIRYCEIGTKTPQSRRRIPFPKALLPHLPKKITTPLFMMNADQASKRLAAFMDEIGIAPDRVPAHSFRHRAADRLRAAGVPEDLREALGGWANGKTSRKYGTGYPLKTLRAAIDKIGF
jgi:integrase